MSAESATAPDEAVGLADLDRRRLEATLAALPVGVWIADADGRLTHTNPAAVKIWGGHAPKVATPSEYGVYRARWPDTGRQLEPHEWHLAQTLKTGETFTSEMVIIERFDGTEGYCLNSTAPILDDDGRITGGVVAQLDVTEREAARAEGERLVAALDAERMNLVELFENAPSFLAVFRGPDFIIERANARYQSLVGNRAIVGMPVARALPEVAAQGSLDRLRSVLETGVPIALDEMPIQLERSTPGVLETRHVRVVYQRMTGADGHHAVVIHGIDMTEQVEARRRVLLSKQLLRDQFAKLPVPTFLWQRHGDDDFVLLDLNDAAVDAQPHLVLGSTSRQMYPEFDDVRRDMVRSLEQDEVVRRILTFTDPAGRVRHMDLTIGPRHPDQVLVHTLDITEREELELQLRQSQKMEAVGRLAGGIAHDFNNLLTVIGAHATFLLEMLEPEGQAREDAEAIARAGDRAAALTRQLLAFSRKQILQPVVLDLNESVDEAHAMLRRLIREDIVIDMSLEPSLPLVVADAGQIGQVIVNLSLNARDAMPEGGRLSLSTAREHLVARRGEIPPGDYVVLKVQDTGVGMSPEIQARLFEPFFTTKDQGKGTGLGLAMVYGIIRQTGGYVTAESAPGLGATFFVYLPAADSGEGVPLVAEHVKVSARGTETVLLVEDDPAVRGIASRLLSRQGYVVIEAGDGEQALTLSQSHDGTIDLVITDAVMPGMGGADVIQRVRSQRPAIRAMLISGYTDDDIVRRGIISSEIAFVQKPFRPDTFMNTVREILDS